MYVHRANLEIRETLDRSRIRIWEIADILRVSDAYLYKILRHELSAEMKEKIFAAIKTIKDREAI
jgi:hypothetical protein